MLRAWGWVGEWTAERYRVLLSDNKNVLKLALVMVSHHLQIPKTIQLYTLSGWIGWCMNHISIKLLKKFKCLWHAFRNVCAVLSRSVASNSLWPHGLQPARLHGDSPGKNTGVGCHALLQVYKCEYILNGASVTSIL